MKTESFTAGLLNGNFNPIQQDAIASKLPEVDLRVLAEETEKQLNDFRLGTRMSLKKRNAKSTNIIHTALLKAREVAP